MDIRPNDLPAAALLAAGALALAGLSPVWAAGVPYNPDHLVPNRLAQVSGVCQTVMGLRPSERPLSGVWEGNSRLPPVVSHYQGCVLSLSDSLQRAAVTEVAQQAQAACREQGLSPGSPGLAVCVLRALRAPSSASPAAADADAGAPPAPQAVATRSFLYASPREVRNREQLACASLGFSPTEGVFAGCVADLTRTFWAIDNPVE